MQRPMPQFMPKYQSVNMKGAGPVSVLVSPLKSRSLFKNKPDCASVKPSFVW